jgi:hypothetical protein
MQNEMDRYQAQFDPFAGWRVLDTAWALTVPVASVVTQDEADALVLARQFNAKGAVRTNHVVRAQRLSEWQDGRDRWHIVAEGGLDRASAERIALDTLAQNADVITVRIYRAERQVFERTEPKWRQQAA